jgi:hypothetical protein
VAHVGEISSYEPVLNDHQSPRSIPVREWWEQVVQKVNEHDITRKDLILVAADKDGGAHVDKNLTPAYKALSADGAKGSFGWSYRDGQVEMPIRGAHLCCIRQLGYEVLNSPKITHPLA